MTMHRVMLSAGVAILVSLAIIVARSQGGAQPNDARAASGVSDSSEHPMPAPITAAEIAELHAAVATVMVNGRGQSAATIRRMQTRMASAGVAQDSGAEASATVPH
jgi:HAMP domain-containing protein